MRYENECGHPEKPTSAEKMCGMCYVHKYGRNKTGDPEFRRPDLLIIPQARFYCDLCGDGVPELQRECKLHPDICDVCHHEYCECQVETKVDLLPLKEIMRLNEDARVPLLRARKMTLRLAGKITNSLPPLP